MPADGAIGQSDAGGNLFVGKAGGQQFENFPFARGKALDFRRG